MNPSLANDLKRAADASGESSQSINAAVAIFLARLRFEHLVSSAAVPIRSNMQPAAKPTIEIAFSLREILDAECSRFNMSIEALSSSSKPLVWSSGARNGSGSNRHIGILEFVRTKSLGLPSRFVSPPD